jgi:hypothetical protein
MSKFEKGHKQAQEVTEERDATFRAIKGDKWAEIAEIYCGLLSFVPIVVATGNPMMTILGSQQISALIKQVGKSHGLNEAEIKEIHEWADGTCAQIRAIAKKTTQDSDSLN